MYRTYKCRECYLKFFLLHKSSLSTGFAEQIMSTLLLRVVSFTTSKFGPVIYSISGFALPHAFVMALAIQRRHGPHRKHRFRRILYCRLRIRCHGNIFIGRYLLAVVHFKYTIPSSRCHVTLSMPLGGRILTTST
jgi:hypothetical protein